MRRLEITKATGCAALIGSGCAQLRREIEATGPQQRRQRAGEAGGRPGHPAAPARLPGPRQRPQRSAWRSSGLPAAPR